MRLLHTTRLSFKEFYDDGPPYAILSHRWGEDEVSYQEFLALTAGDDLLHPSTTALLKTELEAKKNGLGLSKIRDACKMAADRGHEWIWIDTCCIDKSSSSELSEAINSMFAWYNEARICYAYLADVQCYPPTAQGTDLAGSEWFRRGWTLQELLAPEEVVFFDAQWQEIGSKQLELTNEISEITGISIQCLKDPRRIRKESVATRMRWAANRHTTRAEDVAYCLLGLFGVNMPLLYGERQAAFFRLQEAIMARGDDSTILAHMHPLHATPLADEPSNFVLPFNVMPYITFEFSKTGLSSCTFSVTNRGIGMHAAFVGKEKKVIALGCVDMKMALPFLLPVVRRESKTDEYFVHADSHSEGIYTPDVLRATSILEAYCESVLAGERPPDPFSYADICLTAPFRFSVWRQPQFLLDQVADNLTRREVQSKISGLRPGSPVHS